MSNVRTLFEKLKPVKLYTYFNDVPGISPFDSYKLILLWMEHWKAVGFEPFVLTEWHASQHPMYEKFYAVVSKFPSVNPPEYERACWIRWLAFSAMGGGHMCDYDVFPVALNELKTIDLPLFSVPDMRRVQILQGSCCCPSYVAAWSHGINELCELFMTGRYGRKDQGGREHWSDMYAIEQLVIEGNPIIQRHNTVVGYGDDGWEKSPAVHFSNGSMQPKGLTPRWQCIPSLIDEARKI